MGKFIVFCADGTWNGRSVDEQESSNDQDADAVNETNVGKLYERLSGSVLGKPGEDEEEKALSDAGGVRQIAKYLHGVGASGSKIKELLGGGFGAGLVSRIVRGYTFVSRNYEPGDRIVICGFSRGAYTARALAGLIASEGVLRKELTADREKAYDWGARAWHRYRDRKDGERSFLQKVAGSFTTLKGWLTKGRMDADDLVPVEQICAVAVWDTVGSLGLPRYVRKEHDAFSFADAALSPKVQLGLHAVALDEQRHEFPASLWEPAANVEQLLFAGAHSDVGGGYAIANGESGLSDIALGWMVDRLAGLGLRFDAPPASFKPSAEGIAHDPWRHGVFRIAAQAPRQFPAGLRAHESVRQRMDLAGACHAPGCAPGLYRPINLPR